MFLLHETPTTGGFGGEIAATIAHRAFAWFDALGTAVPVARLLEDLVPPKARVVTEIRDLERNAVWLTRMWLTFS